MMSIELETSEPVPVGSEIRGRVLLQPVPGSKAASIDVALRWVTEGRGDTDRSTLGQARFPFPAGALSEPTVFPFRFLLPEDGPVTYFGNLLTVHWELEARLDVPWAIDPKVVRRFTVVPRVL